MSEAEQNSPWLRNMAAIGRDVLTISAVISLVFSVAAWMTRPYWQPLVSIPNELAEIKASISTVIRPRLIDVQGGGQVLTQGPVAPGGAVDVFYSLRRNASCDSLVHPFFYNVDRGLKVAGQIIPSVKAPVTESFHPFTITVRLPERIPRGRYVYYPAVEPKNCGVYGPIQVPPTDIFVVE